MGDVEVPADALWGAQTQRAVDNFPVSGERIGRDLIGALGCIKGAAAQVNAELGGGRRPSGRSTTSRYPGSGSGAT